MESQKPRVPCVGYKAIANDGVIKEVLTTLHKEWVNRYSGLYASFHTNDTKEFTEAQVVIGGCNANASRSISMPEV